MDHDIIDTYFKVVDLQIEVGNDNLNSEAETRYNLTTSNIMELGLFIQYWILQDTLVLDETNIEQTIYTFDINKDIEEMRSDLTSMITFAEDHYQVLSVNLFVVDETQAGDYTAYVIYKDTTNDRSIYETITITINE